MNKITFRKIDSPVIRLAEEGRRLTFVASDGTRDSEGTVLNIDGDKLMVDVDFEPAEINPLAEKVYQKLLFGSLKGVSVGFIPIGKGHWGEGVEALTGENPTYYYAGQELLEVSVVNIPANPNALKKSFIQEAIDEELAALREEEQPEDRSQENENRLKVIKAAAQAALSINK